MFLSSRALLILATLTAIAHHGSADRPVGAASLVARYQLPNRALEPVLQLLSRLQLVKSVRGAYGGYYIEQPERVTVADILRAVQSSLVAEQPLSLLNPVLTQALQPAQQAFMAECGHLTLAMLSDAAGRDGIGRILDNAFDFSI